MKTSQIFDDVQILCNSTPESYLKYLTEQKDREDSFYLFNVGDVIQKVKNWRLKLPRVKMFYAVKCNDCKPVLEVLSTMGVGFDCASKVEMEKVMAHGVDPSRIIFAHPCKPSSHLRAANKLGVKLMTFDNESELYKVKSIMPNARLVLRIRCDALKVQCDLGSKFGAMPCNAKGLLQKAFDLGLNVVGVSFHVGSGCEEPQVFTRAIKICREVFDDAMEIGFSPYLLDIGGGYPGNSGTSIDSCAFYINEAIDKHFPVETQVQIIAEPGRYVVASAFTSATQIISKRDTKDEEGNVTSTMYYVNDGVYGSFNCILYDHQIVKPQTIKEYSTSHVECSIWGPTCDGLDRLIEKIDLPQMDIGDWIIWKDMGAYTLSAAGTFNGYPIPKLHSVIPQHNLLMLESIEKRETDFQSNWCKIVDKDDETSSRKPRSVSTCAEDVCEDVPDTAFALYSSAN